jgi:bifunctional UDP-N-acetylglucosamine pyrophosphorylase / glucosamine-1-phosphate N-acetyltransferase
MTKASAIILAAGLGKRMKSKTAKVLHPIAGRPMVSYAVERALALGIKKTVVVIGHPSERLRAALAPYGVETVEQRQPKGTADAVMKTKKVLSGIAGPILILNADTPLISDATLRHLIAAHYEEEAVLTLLAAVVAHPEGYGRIVRGKDGKLRRIVEDKDASADVRAITEINTGFYVVQGDFLFKALESVKNHNRQKEYYLTDMIETAIRAGKKTAVVRADNGSGEILGINTREDLAVAEKIMRRRIVSEHLAGGVTFFDPDSAWIDAGVQIGRDTVIFPGVRIEGASTIGEDCVIGAQSSLADCQIGSRVTIKDFSVMEGASVEDGAQVGPFTHLRPGTVVRKRAKVGNFVEAKKADIGEGSKANHLSYLGDAVIGRRVNIGAGTITCNYDGHEKHRTVIGDNVFIGSDTQLIAPVKVGRNAFVGAGSTITRDVPADALGLSRAPQVNKAGWAKKRKKGPKRKKK